MKRCTQCKTEKTSAEFGRLKSSGDGLRRECRECRKKYWKKPEERIEEWKKWRMGHMHQLGVKSKGRIVSEEARRRSSETKKRRFIERGHDHDIAAFNKLYGRYLKKGCFLEKELFKKLTSSNCFYCGQKPKDISFGWKRQGIYYYNGLDRVDNLKGYEQENVVPCCQTCNRSKLQMSIEEFKDWIKRIYSHFIG